MNKWVLFLSIFILFFMVLAKKDLKEATGNEFTAIPEESIRLRILANSNQEKDQEIKYEIRDEINREISSWLGSLTSIEEARQLIQDRLKDLEAIAEDVLVKRGIIEKVKLSYDRAVSFPRKLYGSYIYPEGEYEAILITIGEGLGDNWWCVLFPPLCFLDFSAGTTVQEEAEEGEEGPTIKFFLLEWLPWL